ncbi:MAG: hypothetical protein IT379_03295 [Deltaproteobacteria bacterium]|nr:hypothetical protein [Deltaproteobacteria bacterium]
MDLGSADSTCDLDYDGLGSTLGTFEGRIGDVRFSSLDEMRAMTTEVHGVQVHLSVFAAPVAYPDSPFPERAIADLRIAPGSAAVDVGVVIAGLNDTFRDGAPDLGAYELGDALPAYGPR